MHRFFTFALCALCTALAASPAESAGPPLGLGLGNGNSSRTPQAAAARARIRQSATVRTRNAAVSSSGSQAGSATNRGGVALRNRLKSRFELRANSGQSATVRADASLGASATAGRSSRESDSAGPEQGERNAPADRSGLRSASRVEVSLRNRLAAIDRMRDVALESGDLQLLERADRLEARARAQFRAGQQTAVPFTGVINADQQTSGDARLTGRKFGRRISGQAREFGSEFGAATSGRASGSGSEFGLQNRTKTANRVFTGGQEPGSGSTPPKPAPGNPSSTAKEKAAGPSPEPSTPAIKADATGKGSVTLQGVE